MDWALSDPRTLFGVPCAFRGEAGKALSLFGESMEVPFGPAAGPHTQLAQNIIAAYAPGGRFFELKTVQTLDGEDLPVEKPCIDAEDEGYNVEWSTELTVPQAMDEYIKAWYAIKLLSRELSLGDPEGFIFNMSVGYDLAGIQSPKIDAFIEGLKDAGDTPAFHACAAWARANLRRFSRVDAAYLDAISPHVCGSVTLSTLHGCPPEEIERIAAYLLAEKKLHTFVKCNPTLLGFDYARACLNGLGYEYLVFDEHHFQHDLQYDDAVPMLRRLLALAESHGLTFGVKLTNTFPVKNIQGRLPGGEMYMSGRPLFALTTALAAKLARSFGGDLRVSYSGGADAHNITGLFQAGVYPITLATTLLKPGGYQRLTQMADALSAIPYAPYSGVDTEAIRRIAEQAAAGPYCRKPVKPLPSRKNGLKVPLLDCTVPPCQGGCPIGQDVPTYLHLAGEGRALDALRVIIRKNPLPSITGTLCNHRCQGRCRRGFYEGAVHIRTVKRFVAEEAMEGLLREMTPSNRPGAKVAVVGGGPAGLAAAFFLARAGLSPTLFERRESLGGVVRHVIPPFRIGPEAIGRDIALVRAMGVPVQLGHAVMDLDALRQQGFRYIVLAVGAGGRGKLAVAGAIDAIDFLERFRQNPAALALGRHVAVAGAGNTAMDAARAAFRVPGVESVSIVYRRDARNMPAEEEELRLAESEGVRFLTLLSPIRYENGSLVCQRMRLGEPGPDGRREPVPTGGTSQIPADTVLSATGAQIDRAFYDSLNIQDDTYFAGDGKRGPATIVEAIADAYDVSAAILKRENIPLREEEPVNTSGVDAPRGVLTPYTSDATEPGRCLACDQACGCCVDVCPNRANVAVTVRGKPQIVHIDCLCNACGNCETFCPYDSAPYREKFTLFHTEEDFAESSAPGMFVTDKAARRYAVRAEADVGALVGALFEGYGWLL